MRDNSTVSKYQKQTKVVPTVTETQCRKFNGCTESVTTAAHTLNHPSELVLWPRLEKQVLVLNCDAECGAVECVHLQSVGENVFHPLALSSEL